MEKIFLDYLISIARSEEASKTMNAEQLQQHIERMKRTKGVKKP